MPFSAASIRYSRRPRTVALAFGAVARAAVDAVQALSAGDQRRIASGTLLRGKRRVWISTTARPCAASLRRRLRRGHHRELDEHRPEVRDRGTEQHDQPRSGGEQHGLERAALTATVIHYRTRRAVREVGLYEDTKLFVRVVLALYGTV